MAIMRAPTSRCCSSRLLASSLSLRYWSSSSWSLKRLNFSQYQRTLPKKKPHYLNNICIYLKTDEETTPTSAPSPASCRCLASPAALSERRPSRRAPRVSRRTASSPAPCEPARGRWSGIRGSCPWWCGFLKNADTSIKVKAANLRLLFNSVPVDFITKSKWTHTYQTAGQWGRSLASHSHTSLLPRTAQGWHILFQRNVKCTCDWSEAMELF